MGVVPTGEQVGAGQTHIGEPGAVGAAADGLDDGGDAQGFHGCLGVVDQLHAGLDLLPHVGVGVLEDHLHGALAVFEVKVFGRLDKAGLFLLQFLYLYQLLLLLNQQ